jgi:hypothetical protein
MYRSTPSDEPEIINAPLIGIIEQCTNPESAELLPDGETIVFGNCQMIRNHPQYRNGNGNVYIKDAAFISRARIIDRGQIEIEDRHMITGLTATLGCDILRKGTARFPAGTAFICEGANPVSADRDSPIIDRSQVETCLIAFNPQTGKILGKIPLGPSSDLARRFNGIDQPNGLAISEAGDIFVSDIPNGNPEQPLPSPVPPAIYRIPHDVIDIVSGGGEGSADAIERIETPGFINGITTAKDDDVSWAVSCSGHDPAQGGIYRITLADWASGRQPTPVITGLGILDGISVTKRGTILASTPVTGEVHAFLVDGSHKLVRGPEGDKLARFPADINVCYPNILGGEPALLVPDVSMLSLPGEGKVTAVDLAGL